MRVATVALLCTLLGVSFAVIQDTQCVQQLGECMSSAQCPGSSLSGYCPSSSGDVKCCIRTNDAACASFGGQCTQSSACSAVGKSTVSGKCPSYGSTITCCYKATTAPPPTTAKPTTAAPSTGGTTTYTPAPLVIPAGSAKCVTPYSSRQGNCIAVSTCSGATYNGLCSGSSKCCVAGTASVTYTPQLTFNLFTATFTSVGTGARAQAMYAFMNSAMKEAQITGCYCTAAFIAQVSHESGGLMYFEELASGSEYEGRKDLGNTQPGDGPRYKGRGPIQLTGRSNYAAAGKSLGVDLVSDPERVCMPDMGWRTTAWFWSSNGLNRYCTSGTYDDFVTLTKRINGGTNGLSDRVNLWNAARKTLGCP